MHPYVVDLRHACDLIVDVAGVGGRARRRRRQLRLCDRLQKEARSESKIISPNFPQPLAQRLCDSLCDAIGDCLPDYIDAKPKKTSKIVDHELEVSVPRQIPHNDAYSIGTSSSVSKKE